ncbi:MAG: hypothetical protein P4L83_02450 [Nevskia sp.]|nr:hypothetical protein [Nevskia sp.]
MLDFDPQLAIATAAPNADPNIWTPPLLAAFDQWAVNTGRRVAVALGQFVAETGNDFGEVVENLNYTHPERLCQVWPRRFQSAEDAAPYCGDPEALANLVYANKLGNGDTDSGDGWLFRGRGLIQLTGRDEYTQAAHAFNMAPEQLAEWAATPEGAAQTGCWYLSSRGCLDLADAWRVSAVTLKVNGSAMLGAETRLAVAQKVLAALEA